MSYEQFRNDLITTLSKCQLPSDLSSLISIVDHVALNYKIERSSTDLIVANSDMPELVKVYLASKAVENKSLATLDGYKSILTVFFRNVRKPIDTITTNDIRAYIYNYRDTHKIKDSSMEIIRSTIHGFFEWLTDEEYILRNPAKKIRPIKYDPPERPFMNPLELETIRHACRNLREKAIVDFLYSTGLRASETCNVLISDVNFEEQTVLVRHGKGGKHRKAYLNAESIISLRAYLDSRQDNCNYLFVSMRKPVHGIQYSALEKIIRDIEARTDIRTHITPHVFRHTTGTTAIRSGMPIEQVQRVLGHANINTTLIYAKTDDADVKANHQKFIA